MICYVTACTTQHTEKQKNKLKQNKKYKSNCTKQHWAVNNPYNNNIFHIFDWKFILCQNPPLDLPSVKSQLLLEGD